MSDNNRMYVRRLTKYHNDQIRSVLSNLAKAAIIIDLQSIYILRRYVSEIFDCSHFIGDVLLCGMCQGT